MRPVTVRIMHPEAARARGRSAAGWRTSVPGWPAPPSTGSWRPARRTLRSSPGRRTRRRSGRGCGRWCVPSARPGWSCSARARSRWRPRATCATSWRPPRAEGGSRSPTTATRRMSWRSPGRGRCSTIPDLPADNALPRWLAEVAGYEVADLRRRWRLAVDIDGPLDLVLHRGLADAPVDLRASSGRGIGGRRAVAGDPARRTARRRPDVRRDVGWLERHDRLADARLGRGTRPAAASSPGAGRRRRRPGVRPRARCSSATGPASLGTHPGPVRRRRDRRHAGPAGASARRGTRRTGRSPRIATRRTCCSPTRIADPWLATLTASAVAAPIPILLGGHTLVGPGVRLASARRRAAPRWT